MLRSSLVTRNESIMYQIEENDKEPICANSGLQSLGYIATGPLGYNATG